MALGPAQFGYARCASYTRSGPQGQFRFDNLSRGDYFVTATAPLLVSVYRKDIRIDANATSARVELALRRGGVLISGTAKTAGGARAPGAVVWATGLAEGVFHAISDRRGFYRLLVPAGTHVVEAEANGLFTERQVIRATRGRTVNLRLDPSPLASGPAPQNVIEWVRARTIPLKTPEPGHGFSDMQPLKSIVGKSRIVALGEATHGTREFLQLKHRMLEFLVHEMGFSVLAIEANWPESLAINEYILEGKGTLSGAVASLYPFLWRTEEVRELIGWMRSYNQDPSHRTKLKFYGFDMQGPELALRRVLVYLRQVDPAYAAAEEKWLSPLQNITSYEKQDEGVHRATRAALARIWKRFEGKKSEYSRRSTQVQWRVARQHARVVIQAEGMWRNRSRDGFGVRDRAMAENVRWLLENEGSASKVVLWAHNGHVAAHKIFAFDSMGHSSAAHVWNEHGGVRLLIRPGIVSCLGPGRPDP